MKPLSEPPSDPWYLDAVFYELPVRSFFDANGDGVGDFPGLTRKLDYLHELGVTALWLLPFHPSPLRDDGYDVADYRGVHPALGTMDDFRAFVRAAHDRGIRVAAEMVVNHTSDRHPWFEAARAAPPGSPLRGFYIWSDSDRWYREAAVQYADVKRSNWTWDPVARAYYWHRFYDHQPDLNYDNPLVRSEVLKVLRFWLDQGVDGLCLNGAAYLVERDGTTCEHLPETHAVLREFRRELEGAFPGRMIQAGVCAWPADAAGYFGRGDECHMTPNLALAQRLFLAVRQEDRHPIADVLRQTPDPPAGCQWVTLLRNHDELTLSLATDEERDYMFREYAADPQMRVHAGIRRRLAPLLDNDRRRIELLFGLLFGLPGAPVIYYGDELGMGDNVILGGRAGVRTPMQWTGDRNAGFSSADPARLFAPPIQDPVFGYPAVNVEARRRDPSSLFHAMRRLIAVRRGSSGLSRGRLTLFDVPNRKVLAFTRQTDDETVLVVGNFSRTAQAVELDLSAFAGRVPVEVFGHAAFPVVTERPYLLTLGPYQFYWFRLQTEAEELASRLAPVPTEVVDELPTLDVGGPDGVFADTTRMDLEDRVLPGYLRSQRWFGGKARAVESVRVADWGPLPAGAGPAYLTLLEVRFAGGGADLYFLPLAVSSGPKAARLLESNRPWALARLRGADGEAILHDALADDAVCTALLNAVAGGQEFPTAAGRVGAEPTAAFAALRGDPEYPLPVVRGPATSSNTLVFYGRRLLLKVFRRLEVGTNPDYEVGRFLTERSPFGRIPKVAGSLEYQRPGTGPISLAILQALVPNQGDGWKHAIDELGRYYERAAARMSSPDPVPPDPRPLPALVEADPPPAALETIGSYLHAADTLGRRTAEMHRALANAPDYPAFAPEPLTAADLDALRSAVRRQAETALGALRANLDRLTGEVTAACDLLDRGPAVLADPLRGHVGVPAATKIRIHGDYHLGQVLWVDNDYVILDFEGEPTRSVDERRAKFSPLRDVAGMLRSYHYAAYAGLFAFTRDRPDDFARLEPWADLWHQWAAAAFLRGYQQAAGRAHFLPTSRGEFAALLDGFMLGKAFYELAYELNNRPDWVRIPLRGILALLGPARR